MAKPTLAIYGIQDIDDNEWPNFIHDHSICLMENGETIQYMQLERHTRKKHDNKLHNHIHQLLKDAELIDKDADIVFVDSTVGRSFISKQGNIRFEAPLYRGTLQNYPEKGYCLWYGNERNAWALNHELAHVYSCVPFFGDFQENSLCIHFDGGGSRSNFSAWHFKNDSMKLIEHHWELKYLSSLFNSNALSFALLGVQRKQHNSIPGKLMGFSSFGTYSMEIENWLQKNDYFANIWGNKQAFFQKLKNAFGISLQHFSTKEPLLQDIAATIQYIFTRDLLKKLRQLQDHLKVKYLYYTGGSALNIVTNTAIVKSGLFEDVFIPPCTEDSGLSLGAATLLEINKGNTIKASTSPYLNNWGISEESIPDEQKLNACIEKTIKVLIENKIVGVCNGFGEIGPRALGNRSILALPNNKKLAKKVSMQCKKREWYRPVAPVMLSSIVNSAVIGQQLHHLSDYMLLNYDISREFMDILKGVVHIDGTARIQTIEHESHNPFIYGLLTRLNKNHSIPALINTSFNYQGQPIVHTKNDAIDAAKTMGIDGLVYNYNYFNINT